MDFNWVVILGGIGSIASIFGLYFAVKSSRKSVHKKYYKKSKVSYWETNIGNISINQVFLDIEDKANSSGKIIPKIFIENLPKIKYNIYKKAKVLWDTGVTSEMLRGNALISEKLLEILLDLAELAIEEEKINGISIKEFYKEKIKNLTDKSYDAQPIEGGTIHLVIASGEQSEIIDEFIVSLIKRKIEKSDFKKWLKKWENSKKFALEEREIDTDLSDKL